MSEYLKHLSAVIQEHGFESYLETPEHEVETPRHFIRVPGPHLGPMALWKGRNIAEITSEAASGAVAREAHPDPAELALYYGGLTIHVLSAKHLPELQQLAEHLRCDLREPVTLD